MKKIKRVFAVLLVFALLCSAGAVGASAAPIDITDAFTDANFRSVVYNTIGKTAPEPIYDTDTARKLTLYLSNRGVESLDGLEYFPKLESLTCNDNKLTQLPALPSSLKYLDCKYNQLATLPALPSSLGYLACGNNLLTQLPALPQTLTSLRCSNNKLTSLPALPSNLALLMADGNQLTQLPALPQPLVSLYCLSNKLTALPALPSSLQLLSCSVNQLTELPALPLGLQYITCGRNQLTELPELPAGLKKLSCNNNQFIALPALPDALEEFDCSANELTELPELPPSLRKLYCFVNQLTELPKLPSTLTNLTCFMNQLTSIDVTGLALEGIHCYGNNMINKDAVIGFEGTWDEQCFRYGTQNVPQHTHSYTPAAAATPPTCTEAGYTTYTCDCGDSYTDDQVDASGHSYTPAVTAPTCTEAGYTTYTCDCGDSYTDDAVDAAGHAWQESARVPAELNKAGRIDYACQNNPAHTRFETLPALGGFHDAASSISIIDENGILPSFVTALQVSSRKEDTKVVVWDGKDYKDKQLWEIDLIVNGEPYHELLPGMVTVRVPVNSAVLPYTKQQLEQKIKAEEIIVTHIVDKKREIMSPLRVIEENGKLFVAFETNCFSEYTLSEIYQSNTNTNPQAKGIFGTNPKWDGKWWHYLLFFVCFGWIWMWF